jgi:hypothetical protein
MSRNPFRQLHDMWREADGLGRVFGVVIGSLLIVLAGALLMVPYAAFHDWSERDARPSGQGVERLDGHDDPLRIYHDRARGVTCYGYNSALACVLDRDDGGSR